MRILFVCLGNICRSPLAEGIFLRLAREADAEDRFQVDSAGTGAWHVGEAPDPRSVEVAKKNGIELVGAARQIRAVDFSSYDMILAMDADNLRDLERLLGSGAARAKVSLLRQFDPDAEGDLDVPDPYFGGPSGFDDVFQLIHRACRGLISELGGAAGKPDEL